MLLKILKQKFLISFLVLLSLVACSFIFAPKALAANRPSAYKADEHVRCAWINAWFIQCSGINYLYDVQASKESNTDTFRPQSGDIARHGYVHITQYHAEGKDDFVINTDRTSLVAPGNLDPKNFDFTGSDKRNTNNNGNIDSAQGPISSEAKSGKDEERNKLCSIINTAEGCLNAWDGQPNNGLDGFVSLYGQSQSALDAERDCGDNSSLNFITCPIFNMVNKTIGKLIGSDGSGKGLLIDMFYVRPLSFQRTTDANGQDSNPLYSVWDNVKNIALSVYVFIFLIVIFSNSMSLGIDAYTIKKTLPRLFAAAIFTQFSFLFLNIAIDMSNVIGIGLPSFVLAQGPKTFTLNISGIWGGAASVVSFLLILILAIMALFSLIVALITIVARQLIVFALVITAPIAIACWVLPNTQKIFKKWWNNLWRILAMFPIATGLIAVAILFSRVTGHQTDVNGNHISSLAQLAGAMAPLIALAILPKTFKWGGDFVAAATGAAAGWVARGQSASFKKGKDVGKAGLGGARDRVALNAGNSRFLHGISGGGWRNSSRKNMIRRGQNKGRILGEYEKAAQYAEKDQLRQLAGSKNKGMQMAAIGRMAKKSDLEGLTSVLASGQVTRGTYKAAVEQYHGDFDKMPQMRSVAFADEKSSSSRAIMTSVPDGKGGTTQRPAIQTSFYAGMSGESLAGASTDSKKHIMGAGEVSGSAVNQILSTPALEAKFSSEDIATLRGLAGATGTTPSGTAGGMPAPAPGSSTPPIVVAPTPASAPHASTSSTGSSEVVAELKRIGSKLDDIGSTPPPTPPSSPEPHRHDPSSGTDSSHLPGSDSPPPPWLRE